MSFLAMLMLVCGSPFIMLVRAHAIDAIWRLLIEPRLHADPGVVVWFGALLIWDVMAYGLKRGKADGEDAFEGHRKWAIVRAFAILQGRSLFSAGIASGVAVIMRFMMGW